MAQRSTKNLKKIIAFSIVGVSILLAVGVFQSLLVPHTLVLGKFGWYAFAFVSGLMMIALPSMLPMVFVAVPLSSGRRPMRGLMLALAFGLGVAVMLSLYGILVAQAGKTLFSAANIHAEDIKNVVYFISGIFAYVFALSEIGLIKFRMTSYVGELPGFIRKRGDFMKAFLLGLLLGNIGIGSPHPAMPLLIIESASSANVFYGWSLFLMHAIGRIIPLILLSLVAMSGSSGVSWLVKRKGHIVHAGGWVMVFVAGFILMLGLFSSSWYANSGQPYALEKIISGELVGLESNIHIEKPARLAQNNAPVAVGMFGQSASWGNWFLVFLWVLPLFWHYRRERARVFGSPAVQINETERRAILIAEERQGLEMVRYLPFGEQIKRVRELEHQTDGLMKDRIILEEAMRYGAGGTFRDPITQEYEEQNLCLRRNLYLAVGVLLVLVFVVMLPNWFASSGG